MNVLRNVYVGVLIPLLQENESIKNKLILSDDLYNHAIWTREKPFYCGGYFQFGGIIRVRSFIEPDE